MDTQSRVPGSKPELRASMSCNLLINIIKLCLSYGAVGSIVVSVIKSNADFFKLRTGGGVMWHQVGESIPSRDDTMLIAVHRDQLRALRAWMATPVIRSRQFSMSTLTPKLSASILGSRIDRYAITRPARGTKSVPESQSASSSCSCSNELSSKCPAGERSMRPGSWSRMRWASSCVRLLRCLVDACAELTMVRLVSSCRMVTADQLPES